MNTATRSLFLACLALASPPRPAAAQEVPPTAPQATPAPPSFDELQATIARMQRQLDGLGAAASERDAALRFLEQQVDQAAGQITGTGQANEALRGEAASLSTRMEDLGRDRERLSREAGEQAATVDQLAAQVAALTGELERERGARAGETARLTAELAGARRALDEAQTLLSAAETKVDQQQDTIDGLDERLAEALAARVEELERYRSEFFGRLRQALGDRPDLRVVGDRFVFPSELLFASGSATLDPEGGQQLQALARTLKEVTGKIPPEIDWVLRVDGHTDRLPIPTSGFRSNWELSVARAISVIEFLVRQGIPPNRLAAAGFGEYRPLDPRDVDDAYRRNRRIEFKLTES